MFMNMLNGFLIWFSQWRVLPGDERSGSIFIVFKLDKLNKVKWKLEKTFSVSLLLRPEREIGWGLPTKIFEHLAFNCNLSIRKSKLSYINLLIIQIRFFTRFWSSGCDCIDVSDVPALTSSWAQKWLLSSSISCLLLLPNIFLKFVLLFLDIVDMFLPTFIPCTPSILSVTRYRIIGLMVSLHITWNINYLLHISWNFLFSSWACGFLELPNTSHILPHPPSSQM